MCLVLPLFWFGVFNFYSGLSLYDAFIYQLYNILYSSLPIIIYGIIDQEYKDDVLVENKLNYYLQGIEKKLFNTKVFWSWFTFGTYVSVVLTFLCFSFMGSTFANDRGLTFNFWETSTEVYGLVVMTSNVQILTLSNTYNALNILCVFGSVGVFPLTLLIYMKGFLTEFSADAIGNSNSIYLYRFVIICACCLPFLFLQAMKSIEDWLFSNFKTFLKDLIPEILWDKFWRK